MANCEYCTAPLAPSAGTKPRRFCGDACRKRFARAGKQSAPMLPMQDAAAFALATPTLPAAPNGAPADAREVDRLRKQKAASSQFALAADGLAHWQETHPVRHIQDWCERYFTTPFLEKWRAPKYMRDFLSVCYDAPPAVRSVALHKAAQLGFTSALQATVAYGACRGRKHVVVAQPTAQDAIEFRRDSVTPLFDGIDELALLASTVRGDQSTTTHRVYKDSSVRIQGGLKPGRWRRFVADIVCIDERDAMPLSASAAGEDDGEGDVVALALRALQNRSGRLIAGGTPTSALGPSRIVAEARDAGVSMVYTVRCPSCGAQDDLSWERLKWPDNANAEAAHIDVDHHCSQCGAAWRHDQLAAAIEGGRWTQSDWQEGKPFPTPLADGLWLDAADATKPVLRAADGAEQPWPRSVGFQTWGGYSVWRPWPELVSQWLSSQHNPSKLQAFVEQQLARPWKKAAESVDAAGLAGKRVPVELADNGIPPDARIAIVAVDVQKDWLCCLVTAWCKPDRGWVLERKEFHGGIVDAAEGAWAAWAAWMRERWPGNAKHVATAIDVGFSQSAVMASIATLQRRRMLPNIGIGYYVKGSSQGLDAPPFKMARHARGRFAIIGQGIKRWQMQALESGRIILADTVDEDCIRELSSEEVRRSKRGRPAIVATGANESADCLTYAIGLWHGLTGLTLLR